MCAPRLRTRHCSATNKTSGRALRIAHEKGFAHRLVAEQAEWLTLPKAIEQTDDLLKTANEQSKPFLMRYRVYLDQRLEQAIARAA